MSDAIFNDSKDKMVKAVTQLKNELGKTRTGRASPNLVDGIKVDYYGTITPLKQMAQVAIPDAKTVQITSWDQSAVPLIEKAIIAANIGLTPNVDGKIIRLNVPPLSEERRKDIAKQVKAQGEESKISIRNVRRDANEVIKKKKDAKEISEDDLKKQQDQIQKITDEHVKVVDDLVKAKVEEVLTV